MDLEGLPGHREIDTQICRVSRGKTKSGVTFRAAKQIRHKGDEGLRRVRGYRGSNGCDPSAPEPSGPATPARA
jgi:hypothetical protein